MMDVGSGAGFPGIPIKIMRPETEMYLLEPSRKKAGFLRHIIRTLELEGIQAEEKRVEDAGPLMVDVAATRALFDIKEFVRRASSHVRKGGRLVLSKGPRVNEELKAIKDACYEVLTLTLPIANIKRFVVIIHQANPETGVEGTRKSESLRGSMFRSSCICVNAECRLRKAGCKGFEGCPGFKAKT